MNPEPDLEHGLPDVHPRTGTPTVWVLVEDWHAPKDPTAVGEYEEQTWRDTASDDVVANRKGCDGTVNY